MPTYCYTCEDGHLTERVMHMDEERPNTVPCRCGKVAERDFAAEHGGPRAAGTWPMFSDAMGVARHQVKEATEHARRIGIPTDFTPDGRAIFTSAAHRKAYCEHLGFYDLNAGYSDPQRRTPCESMERPRGESRRVQVRVP